MIKVNQVVSAAEAQRLRHVDVLGVYVGSGTEHDRAVATRDVPAIRSASEALLSVALAPSGPVTVEAVHQTVRDLRPDYFEFTAVDPEKTADVRRQTELLEEIDVPKVANGFFLLADDLSLTDRTDYLGLLRAAGVVLFQVELESVVDADCRISASGTKAIASMFADVPVLISDRFRRISDVPDLGQRGVSFNLGNDGAVNYDHSTRSMSLSRVLRATSVPERR
ncbi:hypothetical protein ABFU82_26015 [Nocardioides sp. WV_118_6]